MGLLKKGQLEFLQRHSLGLRSDFGFLMHIHKLLYIWQIPPRKAAVQAKRTRAYQKHEFDIKIIAMRQRILLHSITGSLFNWIQCKFYQSFSIHVVLSRKFCINHACIKVNVSVLMKNFLIFISKLWLVILQFPF